MKKRLKKRFVVAGIIICLLVSILTILNNYFDESGKAALYTLVRQELHNYFLQNGCYPKNLNELTISKFPEGSNPSTLNAFHYRAECNWFTCEYKNEATKRIFIMKGKNGEITAKGFDKENMARKWRGNLGDFK
jgi:hypothetical protein